jgi:hypothetical protein
MPERQRERATWVLKVSATFQRGADPTVLPKLQNDSRYFSPDCREMVIVRDNETTRQSPAKKWR